MADSSPLLASLLMNQRQTENPFEAQRKFGRGLITAGSSTAPLQSGNWLEGLSRALQAGIGGLTAGYANSQEEDQNKYNIGLKSDAAKVALTDPGKATEILKGLKGNGYEQQALLDQIVQQGITTGLANQTAKAQIDAGGYGPKPGAAPSSASAIAGIESQGQPNGGYGAVGPVANQQGQRAFGKYQVLEPNIQPWTQEVLGKAMTPQEFLANPQAQDAVFKSKFGQYTQQYGPEGAARAWFAGPGGMNNPNATDVNGMTPGKYQQQFTQNGGGSNPPMQIPAPTSSSKGAILRQQADKLSQAGQHAAALPLYKAAVEADATYADDVSKRDVPGTPAGDVAILQSAIRNPQIAASPEYAAAHARVGKPQMAQGGQLYFPDMTAYPAPAGGQAAQGGRFQDTPESQFKMAQDFSKQYGEDPAVKNWRTIEPVLTAMRQSVTNPSKAADLQLASGLATIYAPGGGGNLPRGEMLKKLSDVESLPAEIRTAIKSAISGQGMDAESRARIMAEAESRAGAHKQQFDAVTKQYQERGAKYGIKPEDFLTGPASAQQPAAPPGGLTMDAIDAEIARRKGGK